MYTLAALSLIFGASALVVPRSSCSFELTAAGGESGTIGQLSDGQTRIGGGLAAATFTISDGGITDAAGRGCILTPSIEQFQCDQGASPTYGFAIESNGTLTSSGSSVFYACPASDIEWNLYTTPVVGQKKCVEITLTASACGSETTSSSTAPEVVKTVTVYDCGVSSSISPAVIVSSTPISVPAELSATSIASIASTSEGIIPSETAPAVVTRSSLIPEASSVVVETSTPAPIIEISSPAPIVVSYSKTITTSYHPHSMISPSSVVETSTKPVTISPTSATLTTTVYHTTAPYRNSTFTISSSVASPTASSSASSISSSSSCVATTLTGSDTSGNYQYPHLIIPVSSTSPNTAYGTQYFGTISSNISTIFNFDIPSSYAGSTCNLIFLLPLQSELETSSYTYSGSGEIEFEKLSSAATSATTYDNAPSVETVLGDFEITEGSSTLISSFSCPAGETVTYELKSLQDTYLYYFQDWNPSPIGLFITHC